MTETGNIPDPNDDRESNKADSSSGSIKHDDTGESTLDQNYPNPFNNITLIGFELVSSGEVELPIYDQKEIALLTLINEYREAGDYTTEWKTSKVASGVYYYVVNFEGKQLVKKAIRLE